VITVTQVWSGTGLGVRNVICVVTIVGCGPPMLKTVVMTWVTAAPPSFPSWSGGLSELNGMH
jgi:hypothetical protein